jgi:hypothetical protein
MAVRLDVTHPELPTWRILSFKTSVTPQPLQPRAGRSPELGAHRLESAARLDLPLLELLHELSAVWGIKTRFALRKIMIRKAKRVSARPRVWGVKTRFALGEILICRRNASFGPQGSLGL